MSAHELSVARDFVTRPGARFGVESVYPEAVWLPIVGPSTFLLWRHLVRHLQDSDDQVVLDVEVLARSLGLSGKRGEQSALARALRRAERFGLLRRPRPDLALVQVLLPPVPGHYLARQHADVVAAHQRHDGPTRHVAARS